MEKMSFRIEINAPKEKVWRTLWDDATYREWTSVFSPGSYAKSDWKEGSIIHFLDGKGDGMYSQIEKLKPNEEMSFRHIGGIHNNQETGEAEWAGAHEDYYLEEQDGKTILRVELDTSGSEMDQYFLSAFPKAMEKIKSLAE